MIETFTALVFAHVLADFAFQNSWMVRRKRGWGLVAHGAVVLVVTLASLGQWARWEPYALAFAHLVIDAAKAALPERLRATLAAYLSDQTLHLTTLAATALLAPGLWAGGFWAPSPWLLPLGATLAGFLIATRAGGFAVGLLMRRFEAEDLPRGLPDAGRLIGLLERGLIFLLVLVGQPAGIGFLIAAKSVLRFDTTAGNRTASEYVIVGTLASFGWAMIWAWATLWLIAALPPLEFGALNP